MPAFPPSFRPPPKIPAAVFRIAFLLLLLTYPGCTFDVSGPEPNGYYIGCVMDVETCSTSPGPIKFQIEGGPNVPQVNNYQQYPNVWGRTNKQSSQPLYWDTNYAITSIGCDSLKGATLIATGRNDWKNTNPKFMEIKLDSDIEAIYVAYDSRANPKPSWLLNSGDFELLTEGEGINTYPCYIGTGIIDQSKGVNPKQNVKMEIWRHRIFQHQGQKLVLPANNFGKPEWPNIPDGNQAMYVVFVQPKKYFDCSKARKEREIYSRACLNQENHLVAKVMAQADCEKDLPPGQRCVAKKSCITVVYSPNCELKLTGGALKVPPKQFPRRSEIEFSEIKSVADIKFWDKHYKRQVRGQLHFDYGWDKNGIMRTIHINSMDLAIDPFDTGVGKLTNISVGLLKTTNAFCQDSPPPGDWAEACNTYRIPQNELVAGESGHLDGDLIALASENIHPVDITLDQTKNTFHIIGGPLSTAIKIDDKTVPIEVSIDLTGKFVNFAPIANAAETHKYVECIEDSNWTPISLNAAATFDINGMGVTGMGPGSNFGWYEDYTLITEKNWGNDSFTVIGSNQLGFGLHNMTLVVHDDHGVTDTVPVPVMVGDSQAPTISAPNDLYFIAPPGSSLKVQIGQAYAHDACQIGKTMVSNDAPLDLIFEGGRSTPVTWTAEDGHGNFATEVQQVKIFLLPDPFDFSHLKTTTVELEEHLAAGLRSLERCENASGCRTNIAALQDVFHQLSKRTDDLDLPPNGQDTQKSLRSNIHAVREALEEARVLFDRAASTKRGGASWRSPIEKKLLAARAYLHKILGDGEVP